MKLNLGCGKKKLFGYINVDINPLYEPDVLADISKQLPFPKNSVNEVTMYHVFEHLKNPEEVLLELYRIVTNRGAIKITCPYFLSAESFHFFHEQYMTVQSLNFYDWCFKYKGSMTESKMFLVKVRLKFYKGYNLLGYIGSFFNLGRWLQNIYETSFLKYLIPAQDIEYTLTVMK